MNWKLASALTAGVFLAPFFGSYSAEKSGLPETDGKVFLLGEEGISEKSEEKPDEKHEEKPIVLEPEELKRKVEMCVKDLGAWDAVRRKRARERLLEIGPQATDELRKYENAKEPTAKEGVWSILQEWGVMPDPALVNFKERVFDLMLAFPDLGAKEYPQFDQSLRDLVKANFESVLRYSKEEKFTVYTSLDKKVVVAIGNPGLEEEGKHHGASVSIDGGDAELVIGVSKDGHDIFPLEKDNDGGGRKRGQAVSGNGGNVTASGKNVVISMCGNGGAWGAVQLSRGQYYNSQQSNGGTAKSSSGNGYEISFSGVPGTQHQYQRIIENTATPTRTVKGWKETLDYIRTLRGELPREPKNNEEPKEGK